MANGQAVRDTNFIPSLIAQDSTPLRQGVVLYADPTTHRLLVDAAITLDTTTIAATQSGVWNIGSNSPTGSAVPANAFYVGIINASGNLQGIKGADVGDGQATGQMGMVPYLFNSSTNDRSRSVINATNSTGTGIVAAGLLAQFDDVSPTTITENQFGNIRMSSNRNLYNTIRDAAGNERGTNVDANNAMLINNAYKLDSTNDAVTVVDVAATALNTYSVHITTNTTNTPTSSTAYISCIAISTEVLGTTSNVTIQDKSGTPLKLVPGLATTATGLTVYNFQKPVKMISGIDVITTGAAAATIDVWIDYYQ